MTGHDLETRLRNLTEELDVRLQTVEDRVFTAVFGFVNGASARIEKLEVADAAIRADLAALKRKVAATEGHFKAPRKKAQ